jgi:hypothetical protein
MAPSPLTTALLHNLSLPFNLSLPLNLSLPTDLLSLGDPLVPSPHPEAWLRRGATRGRAAAMIQLIASLGIDSIKVGTLMNVLMLLFQERGNQILASRRVDYEDDVLQREKIKKYLKNKRRKSEKYEDEVDLERVDIEETYEYEQSDHSDYSGYDYADYSAQRQPPDPPVQGSVPVAVARRQQVAMAQRRALMARLFAMRRAAVARAGAALRRGPQRLHVAQGFLRPKQPIYAYLRPAPVNRFGTLVAVFVGGLWLNKCICLR